MRPGVLRPLQLDPVEHPDMSSHSRRPVLDRSEEKWSSDEWMVDKKTSVIAVLCVTTVLFLGLWVNSGQEVQRLVGIEDEYDKLAHVRTSLEENYSKLRTEKEDLEDDYSKLEREYSTLNSLYATLYSSHSSLKEDYDELSLITEERNAKNDSVIYVTENGSLEVMSQLVPCFVDNTLISYIIRVNATNISDKPLDKVCIFMVAYSYNETTGESWSCTAGSLNTKPLYPQETYTCKFTDMFKEITTYKIFAVVTGG